MFIRAIVSICVVLGVSSTAQAQTWVCGTEYWDIAGCWSPSVQPTTGDNAFLLQSGADDVVVTYRDTTNPPDLLSEVRLDGTGSGTVRLEQHMMNSSLSASYLLLGRNGSGEYLQTAGTSSFTHAILGGRTGSSGRFDLGGSGEVTFGTLRVGGGVDSSGTFVQTGGTNTVGTTTVPGLMELGSTVGSSGSYTLEGGTLTVGDSVARDGVEEIGRWGTGSFLQEAGTVHNVFGTLVLGRKAGQLGAPATGTYTMNGGTLNADLIQVGVIPRVESNGTNEFPDVHEASDGRFIQNDGDVTVVNDLVISVSGGAQGLYELRGGSLTANNVLNNDRFEYSGGELDSGIENHALLTFSGGGTRTVMGSVTNKGQTTYQQSNSQDVVIYEETKNGVVSVTDGTRVSIDMNLTLEDMGTLDIELGSSFFDFDNRVPWISVGGQASIDGILDLTDISGWLPVNGDSWTLLEASTSTVSGQFDSVLFPVLPDWNWELLYATDKITLTGTSISNVPVPASLWLFGSGLLGLVANAWRRKT
ncbi:PEP-CTERM sorting domain-containing protein [Crocinitomicaceae bacterium]|nr:PEP-CTERM sorting domain-containing protein [Crocinitomicaceae bacterium]